MADTQAFAAAIDWGTTNMRLWLLDGEGGVLAERSSGEGMRACMPDRFESVMEAHLAGLGAAPDLPVVVAGMAGARGGWREAAYLETPARLDALHLNAVCVDGAARDVRILPGVCQRERGRKDVMRGEETQLAGAVAGGLRSGLFCLPGTHSKWAKLEEGRLVSFTTFMTGELFALLNQHSILRDTLGEGAGDAASPAFRDAVDEMLADGAGLTGKLFSIRAAGLLADDAAPDAKARLSGLLIGAEIAAARQMLDNGATVTLIAGGAQGQAYEAALAAADIAYRTLDGSDLVRQGLFGTATALWPEGKAI
ncbi:2-dehydro-3-deoxygalactonokinase [Chelativorans salis]|uniref:2-dehydro-3-deoxygalactonokinase n=1 Tax=Chelativorans salis TaxID=2978478 RepID=A0ABT2LGK1_9HYPH|nr:2-dehydro-3-deoxygalactonokinase [Chelativorans sp. EGI FJ00035]MCT7373508.1 2-dehydro-3-deoxygalactonokinase [Chelativorans sp. EGI FJ00035]